MNRRSKSNAQWDNIVDIDVNVGDMLNVESATLHLRGISSDATIELLGEDNQNGLSDSKIGMRFIPYVCDTGWNTVALPAVCANKDITYPLSTKGFPSLDFNDNLKFVLPQGSLGNDSFPYDANSFNTEGWFWFDYEDGTDSIWASPYKNNMKTLYTEKPAQGSWNSITGHKYTILDENYRGPYRKNSSLEFMSDENDCKPMYLDAKVDVAGPLYESPSTIADRINAQLNSSDVYGAAKNTKVKGEKYQETYLPSLTGNLMKVKRVNGYDNPVDEDDWARGLWGNIAVRDLGKWQGIHALMRADLAFDYNVSFNDASDLKQIYQPCIYMPGGHVNNSVNCPYTTFEIAYKYVENFQSLYSSATTVTKNVHYGTFSQYQLFTTNMKYNEDNIKRIQTFMRNTEKYDGNFTDNEDSDIDNWRSHFDIGTSQQSSPTNDDASKWFYYIGQGNFNLASGSLPTGDNDPKSEAYAYAYPYHPFPDKCPIRATSRSDIPDVGYTRLYLTSENIEQDETVGQGAQKPILNGLYALAEFSKTPPHFFKNNKNQDASIAFFSKYDSDWKTKVKLGDIDTDDMDLLKDDSLSEQYNVGCYPVKIYPTDKPKTLYNIESTIWVGKFTTGPADLQTWLNGEPQDFTFKFETGHDNDHEQYGGLSLYVWQDNENEWEVQDDAYIYSCQNSNVKDGRDSVQGVAFGDNYNVDLENNNNQFVIDFANDKRFIMVFWDETDLTHCNIYQLDGFSGNNYEPFGSETIA